MSVSSTDRPLTPHELVQAYLNQHFRIVTWPAVGDEKGPRETGWPQRIYTIDDYHEGDRVGILTGTELGPQKYPHDVDIDWAPGSLIAQALLPPTSFVFGRSSKKISHCFYTLSDALPSSRYEDIDRTCLIELRGTKVNGELGLQTMVPPSIWTKEGQREPLIFVRFGPPTHFDPPSLLKQKVCLSAIGMILAKHLGKNGFGHEARLAWAGYLLRASIPIDDLVTMGEAMSQYTNNLEINDVRRVVESTAARLSSDTSHKIKGGPALAKILGTHGKAIIARINEWLGRDSDFVRNSDGMILKDHQGNIRRAVSLLGHELFYDEFSDKLLIDRLHPLEDRQLNDLYLRIDEEHRFRPTFLFFEKVIKHTAWANAFHPVKEYLASLTWDQTPRINTWLVDCAGADDSAYLQAVSSILLIAAVRRIYTPGCKYDELLVLEGAQGINKSSALRALCPRSEWFSDDMALNLNSQRMIESTLGKWIIEAADLAGKRKAEIEQLKANLSRQVDGPARLAYAHLPVERPRQFVMVGTTNSVVYLTDQTGARRFWPVHVEKFNLEKISQLRDQLWAEAVVREHAHESIRLDESLWPDAGVHQEARRGTDPWEEPIRDLLLRTEVTSGHKRRLATSAIWTALSIQQQDRDRSKSLRISEIMQRFGFVHTRVRPAGGNVEVGFVGPADMAELPHEGDIQSTMREPGSDDEPF